MKMSEPYMYVARIIWVFDFMTISHLYRMELLEEIDIEAAEERVTNGAEEFIEGYYGIKISDLKPKDISIFWEILPGDEQE